ncbi:MAG TPA: hypothetical protein VJZ26_13760 [Blastocatellia bacterium]|nr:hypothetical protein [Blastocatellia bacterium]
MEKRKDDRDAKKSTSEATDDPREANKGDEGEQAAELQVGEEGERDNLNRFAPDSKEAGVKHSSRRESEDTVDEP